MYRHEARAQHAAVRAKLHGSLAGLGHALIDLARLLGHVHVERQASLVCVLRKDGQPRRRNGAHRVGRKANGHVALACVPLPQRVHVCQYGVGRRIAEATLAFFGLAILSGARVGAAKERNAKACVARGLYHHVAHERAVRVRRAVCLVMDVVELAHGPNARVVQLAKGHARDPGVRLRRELGGGAVHLPAPRPEVVCVLLLGALSPAPHGALERVRVRGGQRRQDQAPGPVSKAKDVRRLLRHCRISSAAEDVT
jgi:hypothetical protein